MLWFLFSATRGAMNNVPPPYEPTQPQWYAAPPPAYAPPPEGKLSFSEFNVIQLITNTLILLYYS